MGSPRQEGLSRAADSATLQGQILAQIPLPIAVKDRHGRYLFVNKAYAQSRGESIESIQRSISKTLEADREVIDSGRPCTATEANQLHSVLQTTRMPIDLSDGTRALLEMAVDITKLRQTDDQRRHLENEIVQTQHRESLGSLASGVAHDFNNILVGILGNVGLMQDDPRIPPQANQRLQKIENAALRCADLSKQVLAYSGHGQPDCVEFDVSAMILRMRAILDRAVGGIRSLNLDLGEGVYFKGNPTSLHQIVLNLVCNAAQSYGDASGTISLRTRVHRSDTRTNPDHSFERELPDGDYLCLEVCDEGAGMTPSTLAKSFTAYFTTRQDQRGLGLNAVATLAHRLGGAVRIETQKEQGTRVRILLPRLSPLA